MEIQEEKKQSWWELVRFVVIALLIVIPARIFIVQPFVVSGSSMFPTFEDGNYLIVDEISYRFKNPKRGDVVIFRYPNDPKKFYIKRIIGLPGETIKITGSTVTILNDENPNGFVLDQPYVKNQTEDNINRTLNNNEYFVMGDNRGASSDSRYWGGVPKENLVGQAFLRLWPIGSMDVWPGQVVEEIYEQNQ